MTTVNKKELTCRIAEMTGMTQKDSAASIDAFTKCITEALANGERVMLVGFGSFETRERKPRQARNPRTNEKYAVPAQKAAVFKSGKELKNAVNTK